MTRSGESVYREIKEKITELEAESARLRSNISSYEKQTASLVIEREQKYIDLATTYLPELTAKSIKETLSRVQGSVEEIFKDKQERRVKLEDLMSTCQTRRKKLEEALENITADLNKKSSERDKIMQEISNELESNSKYAELDKEAKKANEDLDRYKVRVKEVENEAKQKLPAYEKNKLFMYLLGRNFGDKRSQKSGIIKKLDSWVAKIINYKDSKKCYGFLCSMPDLMKVEVDKRQEALNHVVKEMQKIEDGVSERYGLPKVVEEGKNLSKARDEFISEIDKEDSGYQRYSKERKELENTKGAYHQKAVQTLKSFLKGQGLRELKARARATDNPEDDIVVDRLEEIERITENLKYKKTIDIKERDKIERNLDGLKEIKRNFNSRNYNSSRSYLKDGFDFNVLLIGYLAGRYNVKDINNSIESYQKFKPKPAYHSSSSYSSSSGGFGGGGFSGGGGFGGGGFSSGGGF